FAVLTSLDREPLATRNAVTTAPSLRTFARAYRNDGARRGSSAALFAAAPLPGGNLPPLPQSVSEVAIASRSYADATIERHATRAQFLARSGSCAVVHFAGHVVVHAERPLFSALVFENGELLYAHELDGRSFAKARLVVLSGCDSGRTPRPTMSVANALLSQSVPSVVYTLWPVGDDVAEAFSIALHRAIAAGHTRADAVRVAQLALKQKWPNDVEAWAAFALAGAPGALEVETKGERLWTGIRSIR
ncbi:MAG TPA: CHAT domain-containing protein, partial [Thermoanaerobaculia bacterium]